ncbi:MAG: hypothetical protein ACW96U_11705 [Candidatus Heimdallarchaeaceae archaeon]|jgi:hypothetical protein
MSSIEKTLGRDGLIELKNGRYVQTGDNCYEIMKSIANHFGYKPPSSKEEIRDTFDASTANRLWGGEPLPTDKPTEACVVIREPETIKACNLALALTHLEKSDEFHLTFEHQGKEFNYGAKFPITGRIFLRK